MMPFCHHGVRPGARGGAAAYDGRAMMEAPFCQEKQALGLGKRRQHTWEAQQMGLLFARLAHLLRWGKRWLSRVPPTRWR